MMSSDNIEHITPEVETLSSISVNLSCPQGCSRTFANSSALRLHLIQLHHEVQLKSSSTRQGVVWYHCPVVKCPYHNDFGTTGKHFLKLKYLKQHYLKVHAERNHVCQCGQKFSTRALLAHHSRYCGLSLLCTCGRSFSVLETLQTHIRRAGHALHHTTVQALQARKESLNQKTKASQQPGPSTSQALWPHHFPLKYHNIDGTKPSSSTLPGTSSPGPANICPAPAAHIQQPTHLLAAIALSELGATSIKRLPYVDVGVQTEAEVARRSRRKSSSPAKCWEPSSTTSRSSNKRKRTAETQTRLTHRDSKKQQSGSSAALTVTSTTTRSNSNNTDYVSEDTEDCTSESGSFSSLSLQIDLPEFMTAQHSSSGTQTSPRGSSRLTQAHLHNFTFTLFDRACGEDKPSTNITTVSTINSTQTSDLESFPSTQLLIEDDDDDDDLLGVVSNGTGNRRQRPPPLCSIRSSSIETQTDHDVLLSKNADMPDDTDEIILTTTETQTDPSSLLAHSENSSYQDSRAYHSTGSDSLWCTSETQTYEDFSDIEQFMCSTIHTQTSDQTHSELFPELSFTHTQTQTSLDDPPALVTTHTQTPLPLPQL